MSGVKGQKMRKDSEIERTLSESWLATKMFACDPTTQPGLECKHAS